MKMIFSFIIRAGDRDPGAGADTYGRLPSQQAVDLRLSKEWKVGGRGTRLLLSADVFNVLNTDTYQFVFSDLPTRVNPR